MWFISLVLLFISGSTLSFAHTEACSVSSTKGQLSVGGAEALIVSHNKIMEVIAPWEMHVKLSESYSAKIVLTFKKSRTS